MKNYKFYNPSKIKLKPLKEYKLKNQYDFYDALSKCWSISTCAPRLRKDWSKDNITLGQCSITSFLIQDYFGGEVFGVPLKEGGFHCFNVVNGIVFDLTSEQFGDEKLDYINVIPQSREEHFKDIEKYNRYLLLKHSLIQMM